MTISVEARIEEAKSALAQAQLGFNQAQEGRDTLNQMLAKSQAELNAAMQDWDSDKSEKAANRMKTARIQLQTIRELVHEDVTPYAQAAAKLESAEAAVHIAEVVKEAIKLANSLQEQQDYFAEDMQELQRQIVELLDKMRKTADGWDAMHQKQYRLAQNVGLTVPQLHGRLEAWGFDSQPLKWVLVRNPMSDDSSTLSYRKQYQWPDAVDGSDLAQYAKRIAVQGMADHYNDRERSRQQFRGVTVHPSMATPKSDAAELKELARRKQIREQKERSAAQEAAAHEAAEDVIYSARPHITNLQTVTTIAAHGVDDDE